ncbi:MAG: F0F1 ATP synthase subunit gamma [Deltaproteobacteria bacterium]|jgi:F-type H+-transporting ATPase subunit gamma|nr:F0F1 ATP synthase subunit gamma [Deltaproteobacteria bacterium]
MASLKSVKTKITGVKKTKQITKAMNMVASAKLRGAQSRMERFRPYAVKFQDILKGLAGKIEHSAHPLLEKRGAPAACGIILVTSDRGLCGGFNAGLIAAALKTARQKQAAGMKVKFYHAGRKGRDAIKKHGFEQDAAEHFTLEPLDFQVAGQLGETVMAEYLSGALDEVLVIHAEFVSLSRQVPVLRPILPMALPEPAHDGAKEAEEYIYEPEAAELLAALLPRHIKVQIYRGLLDTSACEHAARMAAMDNATRNCDEIAASLSLLYNKTRQSAITTDLIDIVSGAEALKG